jgi:hypothetical protein
MQGFLMITVCLSLCFGQTRSAQAAECTWTGAGANRAWTTAANWSCGHAPTQADDVVIASVAANKNPLITGPVEAQAKNVTINSGGILEIAPDGRLNLVTAAEVVTNNGTIKTTGTLDSTSITIYTAPTGQFFNNGLIDINSGTFNIYAYGGGTQTGVFTGQYGSINFHGMAGSTLAFNSGVLQAKSLFFENYTNVNIYATVNQGSPGSYFQIYATAVKIYFTTTRPVLGETSVGGGGSLELKMNGPVTGPIIVAGEAKLTGTGSITGSLENYGTVSPGESPGIISVSDNYVQDSTGALAIELGGNTPGSGHDQLVVNGTATLAGKLDVSLINGFKPTLGQSFTILTYGSRSGEFSTVNLPQLDPGMKLIVDNQGVNFILRVVESGGSISGKVTCSGIYTGSTKTIFVGLWVDLIPPPDNSRQILCGGSYSFDGLADGSYYIDAWLDLDASGGGPPGAGELDFWYGAPTAIVISGGNSVTGIDIDLYPRFIYLPLVRR